MSCNASGAASAPAVNRFQAKSPELLWFSLHVASSACAQACRCTCSLRAEQQSSQCCWIASLAGVADGKRQVESSSAWWSRGGELAHHAFLVS